MFLPSATYRLQFNKNFTLQQLEDIIIYLHRLGISTIYASPLLQATKDSEHCYDVTNPDMLNSQIGTEETFISVSKQLKAYGMSWLQDIVPNHMAYGSDNTRLMDVLERGRDSPYAGYFDIDWDHPGFNEKLMAPFLDGDIEKAIRERHLKITFTKDGFFLSYFTSQYPLNMESYARILSDVLPDDTPYLNDIFSFLDKNKQASYAQWKDIKYTVLQELFLVYEPQISHAIADINNDPLALRNIADAQHYKLCDYREANERINYRRFFSINSLICLRMEDEEVFNDYHRYIYYLFKQGLIQGLRVDHIDGLKDPSTYIKRLKKLFGDECYIIAEKILDIKEVLPPSLDVQGTSGYEFLSYINQLVTDMEGSAALLAYYKNMFPAYADYGAMVFEKKLSFLKTNMQGEWDNLYRLLFSKKIITRKSLHTKRLKEAMAVWMAAFPVYRIYLNKFPLDDISAAHMEEAFREAALHGPELLKELDALRAICKPSKTLSTVDFLQRLMQFTGPLAAKGVEDTTFYLYNVLIAHNEVGDQPCMLGIPIVTFHEKMQQRQSANPYSLNCTATHDTKRGEDNRIRINVLSEMPETWIKKVKEWQAINAKFQKKKDTVTAPAGNDAYFLYQSVIGSMPEDGNITDDFIDRTKTFFTKALREGKTNSSHDHPDIAYEAACSDFIDNIFKHAPFLKSLLPFVQTILPYAAVYSLVQVIIKSTAPGIPDFYQGSELWDLSYVDPDNRRPVDFNKRNSLLQQLEQQEHDGGYSVLTWLKANRAAGAEKIYITKKMMELRNNDLDLFIQGDYIPVPVANGERHVLAYIRHYKQDWLLMILPLNVSRQHTAAFNEARLELASGIPKSWKNIFTGEQVSFQQPVTIKHLLQEFPVAVYKNI